MKNRTKIALFGLGLPALALIGPGIFYIQQNGMEDIENHSFEIAWDAVNPVYDADTFKVVFDGLPDMFNPMAIRVRGYDCPEIRGGDSCSKEHAKEYRDFLIALFRTTENIELRNIEKGKYFRLVADVYLDGVPLWYLMTYTDRCRKYDGGTRKEWSCADWQ